MKKQDLRSFYFGKRQNIDKKILDKTSKSISNMLFDTKEYKIAKKIFTYISIGKEINTKYIIDKALKDKKEIFAPVITNQKGEMIFRKFIKYEELVQNKFEIPEPIYGEKADTDEKSIIIVPAILFNKNGYRIGYGGGYYDRYLAKNHYLSAIGICHSNFIANFENEKNDKKVDLIIDENKIHILEGRENEF